MELARQGARLMVTARREERLAQLASDVARLGAEVHYVAGDITDGAVRWQVLQAAEEHFGGVDALVNNAGVGAIGPFADASKDRLRRIMDVNFFAPVELIRSALPMLRQGNRPIIVNVGSVLGHVAVRKKSEYIASKFALHGFTDALRAELAGQGIDVLLVSPSTTQSEFFDSVIEKKGRLPWAEGRKMPTAAVARKTVRAMRLGKHEIILTASGKLLVWLDRIAPTLLGRLIARYS